MGEGPEESGSSTGSPGVGWVPRFAEVPAALNALRGVCQSVHSQVWWKTPDWPALCLTFGSMCMRMGLWQVAGGGDE